MRTLILCRTYLALQRFYKKAAAFVLRAVAKHSPQLAQAVVDSGALEALVGCLEEFDPSVKESAAWALGYIARHTPGEFVCQPVSVNAAFGETLARTVDLSLLYRI